MKELEWFLQIQGVRSGPFTAKRIVEDYLAGKLPGQAEAISQRLKGESIFVKDLVEAYQELEKSKTLRDQDATRKVQHNHLNSSFTAPPRPVEQLEVSKIITLNPTFQQIPGQPLTPDTTDTLFLAIQTMRDRMQQKKPEEPATGEELSSWGEVQRNTSLQQAIPFIILGLVVSALGYLSYKKVFSKIGATAETAKQPTESSSATNDVSSAAQSATSSLQAQPTSPQNPQAQRSSTSGLNNSKLMGAPRSLREAEKALERQGSQGGAVQIAPDEPSRYEDPVQEHDNSQDNADSNHDDNNSDGQDPDSGQNSTRFKTRPGSRTEIYRKGQRQMDTPPTLEDSDSIETGDFQN